jgi:hypothetical protein
MRNQFCFGRSPMVFPAGYARKRHVQGPSVRHILPSADQSALAWNYCPAHRIFGEFCAWPARSPGSMTGHPVRSGDFHHYVLRIYWYVRWEFHRNTSCTGRCLDGGTRFPVVTPGASGTRSIVNPGTTGAIDHQQRCRKANYCFDATMPWSFGFYPWPWLLSTVGKSVRSRGVNATGKPTDQSVGNR